MSGKLISRTHPDAGTTTYSYDPAGNLMRLQTQKLNNTSQYVEYSYDYNRLISIVYPENPENNVYYEYGPPNSANQSGRLVKQQDASGVQEFFYGRLGELIKNIHTFVVPNGVTYSFQTQWEYDSWNRIKSITYPDGEMVTYKYNKAGLLSGMRGVKGTYTYDYIKEIRYDEFESRSHILYGNDTRTQYTYDPLLRRLSQLQTWDAKNNLLQDISYDYDNTNNITQIENTAQAQYGLGGQYTYQYNYDSLYRLVESNGNFGSRTFSLEMSYSPSGNIVQKTQFANTLINGIGIKIDYNRSYLYQNNNHQPSRLESANGDYINLNWDANGNLTSWEEQSANPLTRWLCWDEENRLMAVKDFNYLSSYIYDAAGERVWKLSGQVERMWINGQAYIDNANLNSKTLYASPLLTVTDQQYTKHYYIEGQRICSKIGGGLFLSPVDVLSYTVSPLTDDYSTIANGLYNMLSRSFSCANQNPGNVNWENHFPFINGEVNRNDPERDQYFYHPDHLGSSSFITDGSGIPIQHLQYLPFGEQFIDQRNTSYNTPYKFSGKEKDDETSYSYFGARYYHSDISIWLSLDPMANKYPGQSPYMYCAGNPVILVDPDGRDWYESEELNAHGQRSIVWKAGHDPIIGVNGENYRNIGETYSHTVGNVTYNYTQNEVTSITTNTMSSDQWVSQYSKSDWGGTPSSQACNKACDAMLANNGNSSNGMTVIVNEGGNGRAGSANYEAENAIKKMSAALDLGYPTKVNIDFRDGTGSSDKMGDHFIVVQGKTEQLQNGRVISTTFHYFDPGTSYRSKGTSSSNILRIQSNRLVGRHINNGHPTVVTSIRPTIK